VGKGFMGFNVKMHISLVINSRFNSRFNSIRAYSADLAIVIGKHYGTWGSFFGYLREASGPAFEAFLG